VKLVNTLYIGLLAVLSTLNVDNFGATERWPLEAAPNESQERLAIDYVRATRSRDLEALRELYYEPSLLCRISQEVITVDQLLRIMLNADIPDEYELSVSEYVVRNEPSELDKIVGAPISEYLVTPTHEMKLRFQIYDETKEYTLGWSTHTISMLEKEGRWYFVLSCPGSGYSKFLDMRSRENN